MWVEDQNGESSFAQLFETLQSVYRNFNIEAAGDEKTPQQLARQWIVVGNQKAR